MMSIGMMGFRMKSFTQRRKDPQRRKEDQEALKENPASLSALRLCVPLRLCVKPLLRLCVPLRLCVKSGRRAEGCGRTPEKGRSSMPTESASRREFIKTAAAAGTLAVLPNAHAAGSDILRVGLIGCGG